MVSGRHTTAQPRAHHPADNGDLQAGGQGFESPKLHSYQVKRRSREALLRRRARYVPDRVLPLRCLAFLLAHLSRVQNWPQAEGYEQAVHPSQAIL
jgi:hypothetical protein